MKFIKLFCLVIIPLVFVGFGCSKNVKESATQLDESINENRRSNSVHVTKEDVESGKVVLNFSNYEVKEKISQRGDKEKKDLINFNWELNKPFFNDNFSWYLFRSTKENMELDLEEVYWYRSLSKYSSNSVPVEELDVGTYYFRVCMFDGWDEGGCVLYSDDLKVVVDEFGGVTFE